MGWKKVKIPATDVARANRLQNDFEPTFTGLGAPASAALFGNLDSDDDFSFYFSPRAASLSGPRLPEFCAEECAPPSSAKAKLLVGHDPARDISARETVAPMGCLSPPARTVAALSFPVSLVLHFGRVRLFFAPNCVISGTIASAAD